MSFNRDLAWQTLDLQYRASISYQLARYALGLKFEMLPPEVVHQAKRSVLDTIGCAIGAYEAPGRTICEEAVKELGGPIEATVFCSGLRTSALNATIVNSFLVRFLDFNDLGGGGHNSDAISSILAVAQREKASGKDFITSMVISYELGQRFRETATGHEALEGKGWLTDIRGGVSMPPALGKMMGLNEDQIANAIGLCASHSLPLAIGDAHREELPMSKNLRFGAVCYDAILSCVLAKKGLTGSVRVIEGESGMKQVLFHNEMDLDRLVDFSGWRMLKVYYKYLPANYVTGGHAALSMAIVKENDIKPEDIASIHIKACLRENQHTTYVAKKYPRNAESGDHSAYYVTAIAIKDRALGPEQYSPEKFTDPVVLDLIEKITIEVNKDTTAAGFAASSEITTKDGRKFVKHAEAPKGNVLNAFLTDAELEAKFRGMASKYMPESQIKKLIDTVWKLDSASNVEELMALTVFPQR